MSTSAALKPARLALAMALAALLGGFGLTAPAAAHVSGQEAAAVLSMSVGRLGATVAVVLGLTGTIIGGLALARPIRAMATRNGRLRATVAMAAGLIGSTLGGLVVATSDSGIGTGNGRGGAYGALVVGLIAMVVGVLALLRSRHTDDRA